MSMRQRRSSCPRCWHCVSGLSLRGIGCPLSVGCERFGFGNGIGSFGPGSPRGIAKEIDSMGVGGERLERDSRKRSYGNEGRGGEDGGRKWPITEPAQGKRGVKCEVHRAW